MNTSRLFASALALSLLGCETSTSLDAAVSTRDSGQEENDVGVGQDANVERDGGGGRDAPFTHVGICTANWLGHDVTRTFTFAVQEQSERDLPNGSQAISFWMTPLRTSATSLSSGNTVGPTMAIENEAVLDDIFDAQPGAFTLPAEANVESGSLTFAAPTFVGAEPDSLNFCGTLSGTTTPSHTMGMTEPLLRCLFIGTPVGAPIPQVTAEDFDASACARWIYVW